MPAHTYRYRPSLRSRLTATGAALAICALIVLALIRMGWLDDVPGGPLGKLTAISLKPQAAEKSERKQAAAATQKTAPRQQIVPPRPVLPVVIKPVPDQPVPFIQMTRAEFAAADISKLGRRRPEEGAGSGSDSGAASGPGEGPGGARLYNAEWYREPTRAEMVTYMPRRDVAGGWAMIACKTQEKFRVEDCRELGESPPGSGLARALRQASWQFLVRPPRVDGKPVIGAWVRIRFDFTKAKAGEADAEGG